VRGLLVVSALSVPLTLTHAFEDFSVGIYRDFGLALLPAAFLLSLGYAAQVAGAALSAREVVWGHALNLALALVWLFGSVLDHLGDVLLIPPAAYRAGLVSQGLEVGIMVISAVWGVLAVRAMTGPVRPDRAG
jgi:hypothetical protein